MRASALLVALWFVEVSSNPGIQGKSLVHIVKCMQHDLPARTRLKLIYLATPKTGSRHMSKFLNGMYNITRPNPECKEARSAIGNLHQRPQTHVLLNMLQEHKGSLPACDVATEAVLEQQITLWWSTIALAEASLPLIATVRDPLEHTLSLFSQQVGWRYNIPHKFQVDALRGAHEPGWVGALRLLVNSQYATNFQTAFLAGRRPALPGMTLSLFCARKSSIMVATETDLQKLLKQLREGTMMAGTVENMTTFVNSLTRRLLSGSDEHRDGARKCQATITPRTNDQTVNSLGDRLRQEEVPVGMIEEIRAQTRLDQRLYDAVVDRFNTVVDATDVLNPEVLEEAET